MTLTERITTDIADAMRARDAARLSALRMAKAALMNASASRNKDLDDADAQQIIAGLIKQRRDSIEQFGSAGRTDLVERETAEIAVLEQYVPPPVAPADLEALVDEAIKESGAASPKDLGRAMKAIMPKLAGRTADGKEISEMVRRKLGG